MEAILFYCQNCDHKIDVAVFATLEAGKCPNCQSQAGFSTLSKEDQDPFIHTTMINDSDLLQKSLDKK